jgi:hypothetical protein
LALYYDLLDYTGEIEWKKLELTRSRGVYCCIKENERLREREKDSGLGRFETKVSFVKAVEQRFEGTPG